MTAREILSFITEIGIVPVVRTHSAESAMECIEAIHRGGVRAAEITMTVPGAIKALEKMADRFGDQIVLGAGTVLDPETARTCMLAGAQFFVTPTLKLSTIEMVKRYSKVICAGALTPTEVLTAWEAGADVIKVFPANMVGGPKYIKALKGPLPQIEMIPTGGVNLETAGDFLKAGACAVAVGGELVDARLIKDGRYDQMEARARQYLQAIAQARSEMKEAAQGMADVRHNAGAHRFEAGTEPNLAMIVYRMKDGAVELVHTEVPEQYQGQGLAGKLATAALEWARASGLKVIPSCPYVSNYIGKHPEFADLVA